MPRLTSFALIAVLLSAFIYYLAPQQLPVTLYKLSLVTLAAWLGYWIDRAIFHYLRPHELLQEAAVAQHLGKQGEGEEHRAHASLATLRRAIIIAAVVLAIALGA